MHNLKQIVAIRREFATTSPRFAVICSDSFRFAAKSLRFAATRSDSPQNRREFAAICGDARRIAANRGKSQRIRCELCMY
jgi:hypothetical protein